MMDEVAAMGWLRVVREAALQSDRRYRGTWRMMLRWTMLTWPPPPVARLGMRR